MIDRIANRRALGAALGLCLLAGCQPCPDRLYTLDELAGAHNARAAEIPALRAKAEIQLTLSRPGSLPVTVRVTSGNLLLLKDPADPFGMQYLLLRGRELNKELFRLGSDADAGVYYFWVDAGEGAAGAWWGREAHIGKPGVAVPFDPTQVAGVLGVLPWPIGASQPPYALLWPRRPASDWDAEPCEYAVQLLAPRPLRAGLYCRREVLLDRRDEGHPIRRVNLYDTFSRRVMTAELSDYQPVAVVSDWADPEAPAAPGPATARRIDVRWSYYDDEPVLTDTPAGPDQPRISRLVLTLREVEALPELPTGVFAFDPPPGLETTQVDRRYDLPETP